MIHAHILTAFVLSSIALRAAANPQLIRHFTFDEGFKEQVYGHEPVEVIGTPKRVSGISAEAVRLDGESALIYDNYFDLHLETFTLTAWVYSDVEDPTGHIASKGANSYWINLNQGEIRAGFYDTGYREGYSGIYLQPGQWYFIAITYDGEALRLYLNHHLHWIREVQSAPQKVDGPLVIGARGNHRPHAFLNATVDEVRLYDGALPHAELLKLLKQHQSD